MLAHHRFHYSSLHCIYLKTSPPYSSWPDRAFRSALFHTLAPIINVPSTWAMLCIINLCYFYDNKIFLGTHALSNRLTLEVFDDVWTPLIVTAVSCVTMRQKRAKTYKRLMELYSRSFGFRQPYQVLVDSSFCTYCTQNQIDIPKQLGTVLQGQQKQSSYKPPEEWINVSKPGSVSVMTQCSIVELYKLGPSHQRTVDLAKTFERRKCNHREAIPGEDCIKSVVGECTYMHL